MTSNEPQETGSERRFSGRSRFVAALTAVFTAAMIAGCSGPAAEDVPPELSAVWSDEFDGAAGQPPDATTWVTETGNLDQQGWGNNELQFYTSSTENVALDGNGNLSITALPATADSDLPCFTVPTCPFTSARLTTEGTVSFEIGRVEVRAQLPNGSGLLPAIWLLGDNGEEWPAQGEIDIAEVVGGEPTIVYGTVHGPTYFNENGIGSSTELSEPSGDDFHIYAVDKQPGSITWSVDGQEYFTLTPEDLDDPDDWVFDQSMHVLLNLAVGGDWPGTPRSSAGFPIEMLIDYVRITGERTVVAR